MKNRFIGVKRIVLFILGFIFCVGVNATRVVAAEEWKSFEDWSESIEELFQNNISAERINVFIQEKYITNIEIYSNKTSEQQGVISIDVNKHEKVSKLSIKLEGKEVGESGQATVQDTKERDFTTIVKSGKTIFNVGFIVGKEDYDYDLTITAYDSENKEIQKEIFKSNLQSSKESMKIESKSNGGSAYTLDQLIKNRSFFEKILNENILVKEMLNLNDVYIDFENSKLKGTTADMEYSLNSTNGTSGTFLSCESNETTVANLVAGKKVCIREKGAYGNYRLVEISKEAAAPRYTIDFVNEKTSEAIPTTVEYSTDKSFSTKTDGKGEKLDLSTYANEGATIYFRIKATLNSLPSQIFQLNVPKRPSKPSIRADYSTGKTRERVLSSMEYSKNSDFSSKLSGSGKQIELEKDITYYFRVSVTEKNFKGEALELEVNGQVEETPSFTIDYLNEMTKEIVPSTVEYSYDEKFEQGVSKGYGRTVKLEPGKNMYFRYRGTEDRFPGAVFTLTVNARPTATAYTIDYSNKVTTAVISNEVEYAEDSSFRRNKKIGSNSKISLNPNTRGKTLYFRKKATDTSFSGEIQELYIPSLPSAPSYSIDFINEEISKVADEFRIGESGNFTKGDGSTSIDLTNYLGKIIYFKKPATSTQFESDVQILKIPERPSVPEYSILYSNATTNRSVPSTVEISEIGDFTDAIIGKGVPHYLNPGNTSKDLYFRVKASSTNFVGETLKLYVPSSTKEGPIFTINFSEERTVQVVSTNMEYAEDEEFTINKKTGRGYPITITPGKNLYFRYKAGYNSFPSKATELEVAERTRVEDEFEIDFINEKLIKVSNKKAIDDYEYCESFYFTSGVKNANSLGVDISPGKNLYIRLRATNESFSSEAYEVMVPNRPVVQTYTVDSDNKTTKEIIPDSVLYKVVKIDEMVETVVVDYTQGENTLLDVSTYEGMTIYFKIEGTENNFESDEKTLEVPSTTVVEENE